MSKTPKLRFKEFSGDWESKRLKDISTKIGDGIHSTPKYVDESEIKFINGNNIKNYKILINDNTKSISENEFKKYNINLDNSSILMSINGTIGNIGYYNNEKVLLGKSVAYININDDNNKFFLGSLLESDKVQRKFMSELTGTTIKNLSLQSIRECKLNLTSKEEQDKIASFFSLIDDKISLQGEKVEALKDYKKGMMQKIFSRELRFKDDEGRDYPEWEEKKLGDICNYKNGKTYEEFVCEDGKYNLISLNSIDIDGRLKKEHKKINNCEEFLSKNDLVMVLSDVAHGDFLGLTDIIPKDNLYVLNQRMGLLRSKVDIDIEWLSKYINYNQRYFKLHGQGSSQLNLSKGDILNFNILTPCLDEQKKIGKFLVSINNKIDKEQEKLDSLNQYKKGLLQQMFV